MRVALSVSVVERGRSGIATYVFGLLEGFRKTGRDFELALAGLEADRPLFERWLGEAGCRWLPVAERFRPALANIAWHQAVLPGLLRREKIDLLHVPSYRRIVAFPPCPQLVTIHDLAATAVQGKYGPARMFYGRHAVRWLAHRADQVCTVSHATAADIERLLGLPQHAVPVIWNGLDHGWFRPRGAAEIAAGLARRNQRAPYFLYVARLEHPGKNHLRLIEAFERFCADCPGAPHELLLGGADWHGAAAIHARIAASPRRDRIRALGFVPGEELPVWYGGAAAMAYPSLFEGFGLPPLEAMACGCPVVCSGRGSLAEVTGGAARLVDPESAADLAAALREMTDPALRDGWVRRGFERARAFTWEATAKKVTSLYKRMLHL